MPASKLQTVKSGIGLSSVRSGLGLSALGNAPDAAVSSQSFMTSRSARVMLAGAGFLADAVRVFLFDLIS